MRFLFDQSLSLYYFAKVGCQYDVKYCRNEIVSFHQRKAHHNWVPTRFQTEDQMIGFDWVLLKPIMCITWAKTRRFISILMFTDGWIYLTILIKGVISCTIPTRQRGVSNGRSLNTMHDSRHEICHIALPGLICFCFRSVFQSDFN
jgi:hypothetical protein